MSRTASFSVFYSGLYLRVVSNMRFSRIYVLEFFYDYDVSIHEQYNNP